MEPAPEGLFSEFDGLLGEGVLTDRVNVDEHFARRDAELSRIIETTYGEAGWFERSARPYGPPDIANDARSKGPTPIVEAVRRLWVTRYNPINPHFANSDIADDDQFPWSHPDEAPQRGWWLSSLNSTANRAAIAEISTGDLVICQRTDPAGRGDNRLVGVCTIAEKRSWDDVDSGRREYTACLLPLARFTHEVPTRTAKRHDRLRGESFAQPRQLPDREGAISWGLSPVDGDDIIDLLSVCGIPPEALTELDTAKLAARLANTQTGNKAFLKLRYECVVQNHQRRRHERFAERRARAWAERKGYVFLAGYQGVRLAGFDLLFVDFRQKELQIEVKGYMARNLSAVRLQPSQAWRAVDADGGLPPDWRLFAVLGAHLPNPTETVLSPRQVVERITSGGLGVKGGWPQPRP